MKIRVYFSFTLFKYAKVVVFSTVDFHVPKIYDFDNQTAKHKLIQFKMTKRQHDILSNYMIMNLFSMTELLSANLKIQYNKFKQLLYFTFKVSRWYLK